MGILHKKKIGLALGSGGWRGLAHIGVIKSLEEHGYKIDYIAGSSVGALVGGLYAYYGNVGELEKIVESIRYIDLLKVLSDPGANLGILKGNKFLKFLDNYIKDVNIEDLKIPLTITATDILNGKPVYITKGSLANAIRASISIPLVLAPVEIDGKKLVDGGNAVPVPTEYVKQMGAEVVIGVNLYGNIFPLTAALEGDMKLNASEIFRLSFQILLNQMAHENLRHADIPLNPLIPEKNFNIFKNFVKEKGTVSIGYQIMEQNIEKLKKLI